MGHLPYYVPRGKPTHSILKSRNKRSVLHHLDRTWQNTETYATDYSRTHATKTQAFSSLYPCVVISGRKRPCDCATIPVGTGCGNSSAQFQFSHYCHAIANSEKGSTHWQTVARYAVASKKKVELNRLHHVAFLFSVSTPTFIGLLACRCADPRPKRGTSKVDKANFEENIGRKVHNF